MKTQLENLRKILQKLKYSEIYIDILIEKVLDNFQNSDLEKITPNLVYYSFVFDLGKNKSTEISNYFREIENEGSFETEMEKVLRKNNY